MPNKVRSAYDRVIRSKKLLPYLEHDKFEFKEEAPSYIPKLKVSPKRQITGPVTYHDSEGNPIKGK